jgi:hypothetical protein
MSKRSKKQDEDVIQRMKEISVAEHPDAPALPCVNADGAAQELILGTNDFVFSKAKIVLRAETVLSKKVRDYLIECNGSTGFLCYNYPCDTNSSGIFVTPDDFTKEAWDFLLSFIESSSGSQSKIFKMRLWA